MTVSLIIVLSPNTHFWDLVSFFIVAVLSHCYFNTSNKLDWFWSFINTVEPHYYGHPRDCASDLNGEVAALPRLTSYYFYYQKLLGLSKSDRNGEMPY